MNIKYAVKAIVFFKGKMLLIKKDTYSYNKHNTYWDIPGGRKQENETDIETLSREFKEEIGIEPEILNKIGEVVVRENIEEKIIASVYLCEIFSDAIKLSDEHSEYIFIDPKTINNYKAHMILSKIDYDTLTNLL